MHDIPLKKCEGPCGKEKPATQKFFNKNPHNSDRLDKKCKVCRAATGKRAVKKFRRYRVYQKYDSLKLALEHKERAELKLIGTYFGLDENEAITMCAKHSNLNKHTLIAVKEELS